MRKGGWVLIRCEPPPGDAAGLSVTGVGSFDPNDKVGSQGAGVAQYISGEESLRYVIYFENVATATAPAHEVVITDQLDIAKLDLDTFSLGHIAFGDKLITPPPSFSQFTRDVDLRPAKKLIVRINASLNKTTGLLTWRFTSIDPDTGLPPEDPFAGFLPPNKNPPEGDGSVLFTVMPKKGLDTGTEIRNKASIVFDANAPIDTPEWLNTIDDSNPSSQVLALTPQQTTYRFEVKWAGTDSGSGVQSYTVFVSENGGTYTAWLQNTAATSAVFTGQANKTYSFYSVARDAVGNLEGTPQSADAATATPPILVSLDAPTLTVAENVGKVDVTVTRSGNLDPLTINYATSNGTASERSDYIAALGKLMFAAGETTKTLTVFVTDDLLVEGDETFSLTLSNPSGGGAALGANSTVALTINDNDTAQTTTNPLDGAEFYVRQHYRDFLNREPDASGLAFWVQGIESCGADAICREVKRIDTSAAFFLSIEFQETGYLVYRAFKAAFGDATSPNVPGTVPVVRLNEFLLDTQRIGQGVIVNQGDWQQQLEANKQAYALEFVQRQRFLTTFSASMTAEEFVAKLDQNAGGVLTAEERTQLVASLGATPSDAAKRAAVLRQVAEHQALRQREFDRAFVQMQYFGYLRRDPDAAPEPGLNFAGWRFWLSKLEEFGGDYRRAEMVKAFISSTEYRSRFGMP